MSVLSLPVIDLDVFRSEPQQSEAVVQECRKASRRYPAILPVISGLIVLRLPKL